MRWSTRAIAVLATAQAVVAFTSVQDHVTRPAAVSQTGGGVSTQTSLAAATSDIKTSSLSTSSVDYAAYSNGFKTVFEELKYKECSPSVGTLPDDLVGTYFRSGPAMFSAGSIVPPKTSIIQPRDGPPVPDGQVPKRMVQHPFDGDGGILGVTFRGGEDSQEVTARFRYIRTSAMTNERRKGQRLYRAMDSTRELGSTVAEGLGNDLHTPLFRHHLQPGLNKNRKNTSNTRAIYWGKRLLSMWEGGQPYKLDGLALSTEGRSQLGGILKERDPFGAKMVIDPLKERAVMYAVAQGAKNSELTLYEFNNKFRLVEEKGGKVSQKLPGCALLSDMAATDNYAIFVQPPVSAGMQFVFNQEPGKVLSLERGPSTIHLVPRVSSNKAPKSFTIPFDGVVEAELQFCNAYEDEDGDVVVLDAIRSDGTKKAANSKPMQWPWATTKEEYASWASKKSLWRYTINTKTGSVSKKILTDVQCSLGVINPKHSTQKHRYIYMAIGGQGSEVAPPQGIARFDCETDSMDSWLPEDYEFCGEPMFAPKKNPLNDDDGYMLSVLFNGKREESEMLVFSSTDISAGPIARIPLGVAVPHGLHGCFTDAEEANWPADQIERRAKLSDKMESRGNRWNEVKSDFSGLGLRFDDMEEYFGDSFLS
jgi:all-trans-8'-apo-beta-carotenal 15,15'-oxygenase